MRSGRHEVHRRRADEAGHEDVHRPGVELLGRPDLLEDAQAHDRDPVAHRHRLDLVVRDVDRRRDERPLQLQDLGPRRDPQRRVEVRERLVHQERGRLAHDRAAERDALALAAGELLRLALDQLRHVEDLGGLLHAPVDLGLRHLEVAQPEREVVVHGHVRVERVRLEHHRHVARGRREVVDDAVADHDRARRQVLEPGEHAQRGALAAARRADEDEELAVRDLEREVVDGDGLVEALRHVVEDDLAISGRLPAMALGQREVRGGDERVRDGEREQRHQRRRRAGQVDQPRAPARAGSPRPAGGAQCGPRRRAPRAAALAARRRRAARARAGDAAKSDEQVEHDDRQRPPSAPGRPYVRPRRARRATTSAGEHAEHEPAPPVQAKAVEPVAQPEVLGLGRA